MRQQNLSINLVTIGMLLLVAALVWWAIYYAKSAEATRAYKGGLGSLSACIFINNDTCNSLDTGNEYPAPAEFLADEDENLRSYGIELLKPNGILPYHPAIFWLSLIFLGIGLALAVSRRDINLASFANNDLFVAYLFIIPSLIGFTVFFLYPAIGGLLISVHEWNLLRAPKFVGIENFQDIFADQRFWRSLRITLLYVIINIPIHTLSSVVRGLMVLPWLLPPVVVGLLWLWMLDPLLGIANEFLNFFGIPDQPFLGSPHQVIPAIAGINIWQYTGYTAILFFAGLKTIPKDLYKAASIDGATPWVQFWRITLPLLRPIMLFVLVTSIIGSFQVFDTIAITTGAGSSGGGPAGSSRVILFYIFNEMFNKGFKMGAASAASVVLFFILILVTLVQLRFLGGRNNDLADYGA